MTKYVKPLVILGLLIFAIGAAMTAYAGQATLSWTAPTTKADGSPLTDLASYSVEWGTCSSGAFGSPIGAKSLPATTTTTVIDPLAPGDYAFRVKAVRAVTASVNAPPSGPSNVVCKTVPVDSVPPNPPVLQTVTTVAYELRDTWLGKRMVAVGSVGLGETCGKPWVRDTTYARLTASQVSLGRKYRGGRLYGVCA